MVILVVGIVNSLRCSRDSGRERLGGNGEIRGAECGGRLLSTKSFNDGVFETTEYVGIISCDELLLDGRRIGKGRNGRQGEQDVAHGGLHDGQELTSERVSGIWGIETKNEVKIETDWQKQCLAVRAFIHHGKQASDKNGTRKSLLKQYNRRPNVAMNYWVLGHCGRLSCGCFLGPALSGWRLFSLTLA